MSKQQQKREKKTEKGNRSSSQLSLIRKCEEFTDITSNNTKRSMFCMMSFSQGLRENNQECLEHLNDTVTKSNFELIAAAFEILCNIECTGINKIRYDFIISKTATNIMEIGHLNSQLKQDQIEEMKDENSPEVIEILDDVDDVIDCSKEINVGQNSAGNQAASTGFRSNIVADTFIDSIMRDLTPTDSGLETTNTSSLNQENRVAFIERENFRTKQIVEGKLTDITSFIIERKDTDDLYLPGIPLRQMQPVFIDLTQQPENQGDLALDETTQFQEDSTSEDVISNSTESFPIFISRKIDKNKKTFSEWSQQPDYESNKRAKMDIIFKADKKSAGHTKIKPTTDEGQQIDDRASLKSYLEGDNNIESTKNANMQSLSKAAMESSLKQNTSRDWGSHNEEDQDQTLGASTKEIRDWNSETIRESKTNTYENSRPLTNKEHGDSSTESHFLTPIMRNGSSNDVHYDSNLLILSRVSPYRDIIRKPRGRRRRRGRGRGKSVTAKCEVKGGENAVTESCRGGSIRKRVGRPKGSGRGKMRGES